MANNYCESSSIIRIPEEKRQQAQEIITRIKQELENSDEGYCGFWASIDDDGVWLRNDDTFNSEHAELLVRTLVNELELDGVFIVAWSYTCDKPRIGEFGGGAFAIQRGYETAFVDAECEAFKKLETLKALQDKKNNFQHHIMFESPLWEGWKHLMTLYGVDFDTAKQAGEQALFWYEGTTAFKIESIII
jgi:hypothetical protein